MYRDTYLAISFKSQITLINLKPFSYNVRAIGNGDRIHLSLSLENLFQGNDLIENNYPPLTIAYVIHIS